MQLVFWCVLCASTYICNMHEFSCKKQEIGMAYLKKMFSPESVKYVLSKIWQRSDEKCRRSAEKLHVLAETDLEAMLIWKDCAYFKMLLSSSWWLYTQQILMSLSLARGLQLNQLTNKQTTQNTTSLGQTLKAQYEEKLYTGTVV